MSKAALARHCKSAKSCTACNLCNHRNEVILGDPSQTASMVVVCEAPSRREERLGVYLPGAAGALLQEAVGERTEYYITAVVLCRPPDNRHPTLHEAGVCLFDNLATLIRLTQPKVLLALGSRAAHLLCQKRALPVSVYRSRNPQKSRLMAGIPLVVTYHPDHILRQTTPSDTVAAFKEDVATAVAIANG